MLLQSQISNMEEGLSYHNYEQNYEQQQISAFHKQSYAPNDKNKSENARFPNSSFGNTTHTYNF
jgi:hypothetical protein